MDGLAGSPTEIDNSPNGESQSLAPKLNQIIRPGILPPRRGNGYDISLVSPSPEALLGAMLMYLDEIAGRLGEMQELLLSEIPEGKVKGVSWTVTEKVERISLPRSMITVNLINDGPDSIFWNLDPLEAMSGTWLELKNTESRTIDGKVPKFSELWVRCNKGETAQLRVEGKH